MKRLFIAINLPEETRQTVANFLNAYRTHPALQSAKWVASENQHITALFLGEVADSLVPEVRELTRGVCGRMQHFELTPDRISLFPPKNRSKMVWLRYQNSLAFDEFVGELKRFLQPVLPKMEEDEKNPLPHVTLTRLHTPVDPKSLTFKPLALPPLEVTGATLYESVLTPEGPTYSVIETFPYGF